MRLSSRQRPLGRVLSVLHALEFSAGLSDFNEATGTELIADIDEALLFVSQQGSASAS